MFIKSAILITTISTPTLNNDPIILPVAKNAIPYEFLYPVETKPNKNTMEYNTMTMEELIRINNENISINLE